VRSQPEVKSLVTRAIGCAILGVLALIYYDPAAFEKSVDQPGFWSLPKVLGVVVGAIVGLVAGGLPGILGGGLLGLFASTAFIRFGLYIGLGAFVIAGVYFFRFRRRMRAVQLTAEESAARQVSIKNIEDYFRRKEELERARAVVAVAKGEAPAWQYTIPPDASPQTVDWERFLGPAPRRPFDAVRFFRWRNYWDYGTGIPGDLFVHLFSGIHFVLDALGPTHIYASGGLRFWKDGRDVPDVMAGLYEYPDTPSHPAFTLSLKVNFANGGGGGEAFRFIGDEGMIEIGWNQVRLSKLPPRRLSEQEFRGWNSLSTFPETMQRQLLEAFRAVNPPQQEVSETQEVVYQAPPGYDDRLDHFRNFFEAVRTRGKVVEDGTFGFRAAAPALLSNTSYLESRVIRWNPETMQLT
jgi:hypothetical protein